VLPQLQLLQQAGCAPLLPAVLQQLPGLPAAQLPAPLAHSAACKSEIQVCYLLFSVEKQEGDIQGIWEVVEGKKRQSLVACKQAQQRQVCGMLAITWEKLQCRVGRDHKDRGQSCSTGIAAML
jgi:hypothetical protein